MTQQFATRCPWMHNAFACVTTPLTVAFRAWLVVVLQRRRLDRLLEQYRNSGPRWHHLTRRVLSAWTQAFVDRRYRVRFAALHTGSAIRHWVRWYRSRQARRSCKRLAFGHYDSVVRARCWRVWQDALLLSWRLSHLARSVTRAHERSSLKTCFLRWFRQFLIARHARDAVERAARHHRLTLQRGAFKALQAKWLFSKRRAEYVVMRARRLDLLLQAWCFDAWMQYGRAQRQLRDAIRLQELSLMVRKDVFSAWRLYVRRIRWTRERLEGQSWTDEGQPPPGERARRPIGRGSAFGVHSLPASPFIDMVGAAPPIAISSSGGWPQVQPFQDEVARLVAEAVNGPEFPDLLLDLVHAFANAIDAGLPWNSEAARDAFDADHSWRDDLPSTINWYPLRGRFGSFEIVSRSITIDNSMASTAILVEDKHALDCLTGLLFIKALHEIGHSLTRYCLRLLRQIYPVGTRGRNRIPTRHTPVKVGTMKIGNKRVGDAGNGIEELLSNGMRVTYRQDAVSGRLEYLTLVDGPGRRGYQVPDACIDRVRMRPDLFYSTFTAMLGNHDQLNGIPENIMANCVVKNAHGAAWDPVPKNIKH
ncbi:unnamed protein product (mitochondrion) [Plasmodiophora brassicae]|uniref:Uncharacterized protein n=2 Tax=Plasmodiophora brassicae TaxID=37360 RepID=A0A3P3Y6R1_PLABS|nr:unnamed protein product [Plasmodiophora brassicae]